MSQQIYSDYSRILLAIMVWREMRSVPDAWTAVAWVAINRANHLAAQFLAPLDEALVQVIIKPWQFSSMTAKGDADLTRWPQHDALWDHLQQEVDDCLSGRIGDPTGGATFYFSLPLKEPPSEWGCVEKILQIDGVQFFKVKS